MREKRPGSDPAQDDATAASGDSTHSRAEVSTRTGGYSAEVPHPTLPASIGRYRILASREEHPISAFRRKANNSRLSKDPKRVDVRRRWSC
jgi:hypothetical protein